MKIDSFVLAIIVTIIIAYFFPQLALMKGKISLDLISSIGISLIFFFYGLKLSTEEIKKGMSNWKLHLLIQSTTFLIFPLIIVCFYPFIKSTPHEPLWLSLLFLAALPSTVSSSVVMISIAKGNISGGIFNASLSGMIGILITPLWMQPFINQSTGVKDFSSIYLQLCTEIILPLILGLLLRPYLGKLAKKHNSKLSLFDKSIILLIIYKSFASSFEQNLFTSVTLQYLILMALLVTGLFFSVYFLTGFLAKLLKLNREDKITAEYCGTKKSLVHGTVFSKALFGSSNIIGLILLPLMLFHAIQIFLISIFASKEGKEN